MLSFNLIQISDRFHMICNTRYMSADVSNVIRAKSLNQK